MAAVAIAAAFNAMTWPQSRTITPSPVGTQPVPRDHDSADGDSPAGLATDRMRHHHLGGGPRSSASRTGAPADALVLVEPNSGFREPYRGRPPPCRPTTWFQEVRSAPVGDSGRVTVNAVPLPMPSLAAATRPLWASTSALTMANPIPPPP